MTTAGCQRGIKLVRSGGKDGDKYLILKLTSQISKRTIVILQEKKSMHNSCSFYWKEKNKIRGGKKKFTNKCKKSKKIEKKTQIVWKLVKAAKNKKTKRPQNWTEKVGQRKHSGSKSESNVDKQNTILWNKKAYRYVEK